MSIETVRLDEPWVGGDLYASCFVDGRWIEGEGGESTEVVNPATEEVLRRVSFASERQVDLAVRSARRAFEDSPWRTTAPTDRGRLLHDLCDLFESRRQLFEECIIDETGSPIGLARTGQVDDALTTLRWFADAAKAGPTGGYERGLPLHTTPFMSSSLLRQEPAGVVAAITAYNYPLLLLARKLGGVLASGCTTIVLPSERAPLSTWLFFKMLDEIGYPAGVANLIVGSKNAGVALSSHPEVDMVSFTGSVAVGSQIMAQAAPTTKKVLLELGGKSPTIILPGADIEPLVAPTTLRFIRASGQGCGCTTRTLISEDDFDVYAEAAADFIEHAAVGDPRNEKTVMGPLIRDEQRVSVEGYVARSLDQGAEIIAGGGRPSERRGYYMNPVLITGVENSAEIAQSELFGPVGLLIRYKTVDEAITLANDTKFGLNAGVWGPTEQAMRVAQQLRSGNVGINGGGGFRGDAPWGGTRQSGIGREGGDDGFREFFEVKHIQWPL